MVGVGLATAALAVADATPVSQPADGLEARIDRYVQPYVDTRNFSGVVLVAREGRTAVRRGYGLANVELAVPNRPETRFHIASVSKPFTAAAILLLQQEGRLDVRDPVSRHVPGYPNGDRITLHHLLAHTSGIPNVNDLPDYDRQARFRHTVSDIVGWFRDQPLEFEPGARYRYSNSNYNLLALVIERVSGRPYGDYLRSKILDPLGLRSTGHDDDVERVVPDMASGYVPEGAAGLRKAPFLDWSVKTGNGSLYSTADDLLRWARAVRSPGLFTAQTIEQMFTEHVDGVGFGWFIRKAPRRSVAINGRSPGFSASLEHVAAPDVTVIVLSNVYSGVSQAMAGDLVAMALGEDRTPSVPGVPVRVPAARLDQCVGAYGFGDDFTFNPGLVVTVERENGSLRMTGRGMGTTYLIALPDGRFLDRSYGGFVTFAATGGEKAAELRWNFGRDFVARRQP
jgi:CubicO group peptidase (beta-lactamase class C family)